MAVCWIAYNNLVFEGGGLSYCWIYENYLNFKQILGIFRYVQKNMYESPYGKR